VYQLTVTAQLLVLMLGMLVVITLAVVSWETMLQQEENANQRVSAQQSMHQQRMHIAEYQTAVRNVATIGMATTPVIATSLALLVEELEHELPVVSRLCKTLSLASSCVQHVCAKCLTTLFMCKTLDKKTQTLRATTQQTLAIRIATSLATATASACTTQRWDRTIVRATLGLLAKTARLDRSV
jgi:uncharacterized membrane protein